MPEVDIEEASRQLAAGTQQVDVRETVEWAEGTSGKHPIAFTSRKTSSQHASGVGGLDAWLSVVALRRSGNRNRIPVKTLQRSGFPNATSVAGGVADWAKAAKPLHK